MNPALFILCCVVGFIIVASLARAMRPPKTYVNSKLQAKRAEYLSGKSVDKRIPLYRGRR